MTDKTSDPNTANAKYNEIMPETTDQVLCIKVDKVISSEGYANNFLPRIEKMVNTYGELRVLVYYTNFLGWEYEAAKDDMVAYASLSDKIKKLALVNPPESEVFRRAIKKETAGSGEIRFFNEDQLDDALAWVKI